MDRLGLFCFFDKEGIVDEYVKYLIADLRENLTKLVIVINGNINKEGYEELESYADIVMVRKNEGYDAGAYKDVLSTYFTVNEIMEYDEVIFCNDTFYGPFLPFKDIWASVDEKDADFWGISHLYMNYRTCIPSYFLVFRKKVLKDVYCYMLKNIDEKTTDIHSVYVMYEDGVYNHLLKKGYNYGCYVDMRNIDFYRCASICLIKYGMPILKKKSFSDPYYKKEIINALAWVYQNTGYNVDLILQSVDRLYERKFDKDEIAISEVNVENLLEQKYFHTKINADDIQLFVKDKKEIYIYGVGGFAKQIYFRIFQDMDIIKSFVVSDDQNIRTEELYGIPICKISEIEDDIPIIVALNKQHTDEVRRYLENRMDVLYLY